MKNWYLSRREFLKTAGAVGAGALLSMTGLGKKAAALSRAAGTSAGRPNFILLVFDALSVRHMSLHGYSRATTPNLAEFAHRSTVFHNHHAAGNFTMPSTASLFTGAYPWTHRAFQQLGGVNGANINANIFSELDPQEYTTITYTHNIHVSYLLNQLGADIDRLVPIQELTRYDPNRLAYLFDNDYPAGFFATKRWLDFYRGASNSLYLFPAVDIGKKISARKVTNSLARDYPLGLGMNTENYCFTLEDAIDWISGELSALSSPFMGYFHLLPPHNPYRPRAEFVDLFKDDGQKFPEKPRHFFAEDVPPASLPHLRQRYDEFIANVDAEFGRLFQLLETAGVLENTFLIVTSDHGELFERGVQGHLTPVLYESLLNIPLLIHAPGQTSRVDVRQPTTTIDLAPTLFHLAGQPLPEWTAGEVLPLAGQESLPERPLFTVEAKQNSKFLPITKASLSNIRWPYKLIDYRGYPGFEAVTELYDLQQDPEELTDLARVKPGTAAELKQEIDASLRQAETLLGL